ncbi:MAG: hypothetical protein V4704_04655 [Pseudomonadota bacterium]
MRRLGYGLLALALLLAMAPLASLAWQRWQAWHRLAPIRNADLDERVLFQAVDGRPLEFNVSTHQGWIALQGFVVAHPKARARDLPLTIEVGLHGTRGVQRERRYIALSAAEHRRPYGLLDGREEHATWALPAEWIDLTDRPDVQAISVRVIDLPAAVHTVLWRGAIEHRLTDGQVRLRYRRLSDASREALTANWVTPSAVVHPAVKQELLRYRQERIGPLGASGEAFKARRVLRAARGMAVQPYASRPLALAIGPLMPVGVELDRPRNVRIDAQRADGTRLPVLIEGPFGGDGTPRRVRSDGRWEGPWTAGRYLLRSEVAGDVDVREVQSGDALVPSGLRPRTHRALAARPLRYRLYALGDAPPPVRLRLRAEQEDARVTVHFVADAGGVLASHAIAVPWRASRYDRPAAALDSPAAVPVQIDLQPPAQANAMRIEAANPVLVHALTTVPSQATSQGPRWYSFQPDVNPRSALSQGVVVVEQPRPMRARTALATPGGVAIRNPVSGSVTQGVRRNAMRAPAPPRLRLRPESADRNQTGGDPDAD